MHRGQSEEDNLWRGLLHLSSRNGWLDVTKDLTPSLTDWGRSAAVEYSLSFQLVNVIHWLKTMRGSTCTSV